MGSNSAKRAQRDAERAENERRAAIAQTTSRINSIYDAPERAQQANDFLNAVRENYVRDADKQKTVADRNLKFSMARSGLVGGSADVDAKRTLGEEYTQGIISAEGKAQGALADLKAQDETSRLNLIQLAQSGLDTTTAAQRAGAAIQASAQSMKADATSKGLGDIFGATANTYKTQQENAARRQGQLAPVGSLYGNGFGR